VGKDVKTTQHPDQGPTKRINPLSKRDWPKEPKNLDFEQ
jgi:hypothetical protein